MGGEILEMGVEVGILTAEGGLHAHATARNRLQSHFCKRGGEGLTGGTEWYRRELTLRISCSYEGPIREQSE